MVLFVEGLGKALGTSLEIILNWWWIAIPFILGFLLWNAWLYYIRVKFLAALKWTLLQLTVPQDVVKSPLAMEQIFAGLHSALYKGSWWLRNIGGRVQEWFSLEIVSFEGKIYFYIYTQTKFRNLVESNIYAQYPDAEIHEVEDYVWNVPQDIPDADYNLIGAEFKLAKEDAYPIRIWENFKFETKEGEGDVDPMASLMEALSALKEGEQFWLQIGIKPVGSDWKNEAEKVVSKLIGRKVTDDKQRSHIMAILRKEAKDYISGFAQAPFKLPEFEPLSLTKDKKDEGPPSLIQFLSPGEREIIESIERNITKVGFETTIRAVYIARREVVDFQSFFSAIGSLKQFATLNLNAIVPNGKTFTFATWPFKKQKENFLKRWMLFKYRLRYRPQKPFIFNIEELATIFHFPGRIVTTPSIPRIETKKGEPPIGLPTE